MTGMNVDPRYIDTLVVLHGTELRVWINTEGIHIALRDGILAEILMPGAQVLVGKMGRPVFSRGRLSLGDLPDLWEILANELPPVSGDNAFRSEAEA